MTNSITHQKMKKAKTSINRLGRKAYGVMRSAQKADGGYTQKIHGDLESLTDTATGHAKQSRQKAKTSGHTVRGQVRERPMSALLLAIG
jgi:hypothetical protein